MRPAKYFLIAVACSLQTTAPALAVSPIPPATLVVHANELPGFAHAKKLIFSGTSALEYTHQIIENPSQAESEAHDLTRSGFQEGVFEVFPGARREIVSEALVFTSAQEAKSQLATYLAEDLASFQQVGLKRYTDPAIPGSVVLGNFRAGKRGATANVLFTTGRCYLLVANVIHDASSRAQANKASFAGAKALYRRVKRSCS